MLSRSLQVRSAESFQAPLGVSYLAARLGAEAEELRFRVVQGPERLPEILALRRLAYRAAGKFGPGATVCDEVDPRDPVSSFVVVEEAGRLVGALRVTLPLPGTFLHHGLILEGPVHRLPARSEAVEAARACVHPDFQGRGLFWRLAAHMLRLCAESGRDHVIGSADPSLLAYWLRCGFSPTGVTYRVEGSDQRFEVISTDLRSILGEVVSGTTGSEIAPQLKVAWNQIQGAMGV